MASNNSWDDLFPQGEDGLSEDFEAQLRRLYAQEEAFPDMMEEEQAEEVLPVEEDYEEELPAEEDYGEELPVEEEAGMEEPVPPAKRPARKKAAPPPPRKKKKASPAVIVGRVFGVFFATVGMVLVLLLGAILIVAHGPSEKAQQMFVFSTNETSALKEVPYWFMDDAQVDAILNPPPKVVEPDTFVAIGFENKDGESAEEALVQVDVESASQELELIDIKGSTYKGKMLIIHDPSRVVIGSLDYFGSYGIYLPEFIEKYGAIAGTNAGGFYDPDGFGDGGIPDGIVIRDGAIAFGNPGTYYIDVIGFDADHVLHVGDMTGQQALDLGIVNAVSFAQGPVLIKDGVKQNWTNVSVNPRTCIGQRADGAVLLAVIEGRHIDSIGASFDDLAELMFEYGAVNAANLDGGSSSAMIYEGEQITKGSNIVGSRRMATAILVLP